MTPHQEHKLRLLTERGTVAFSREENLRKLAVECLELALVIEHHLEGKRGLFDVALEGADVTVLLPRTWELMPVKARAIPSDAEWSLHKVSAIAALVAAEVAVELEGKVSDAPLHHLKAGLDWLCTYVSADCWSGALDVKLSKAERYITDRELGRQPQSLLARPVGGLE